MLRRTARVSFPEARQRAHNEIKKIQFHGMQRRPDIGFASFV